MTDLEVFRLSAEACGYKTSEYAGSNLTVWIEADTITGPKSWNPFINAEQRWQCVAKLLKTHIIEMEQHFWRDKTAHCIWNKNGYKSEGGFCLDCPASEFPARALAELQRRNKKE